MFNHSALNGNVLNRDLRNTSQLSVVGSCNDSRMIVVSLVSLKRKATELSPIILSRQRLRQTVEEALNLTQGAG